MAVWSEVPISHCGRCLRLDPEYYRPFFLERLQKWQNQGVKPLSNYARITKRRFQPEKGNVFDYIEISRVSTTLGTYETISVKDSEAPSRAQYVVKTKDIIISEVRPNRSAVALIPEGIGRTVCSSGFAVLKPERVSPEYLFAYLKTDVITAFLDRETTASMYPAVADEDVLSLPFPDPNKEIEQQVTSLVALGFKKLTHAKALYVQGENLLLEKLGLSNFVISDELFYERWYSEVQEAVRFDAEYFQPKYDEIVKAIKNYKCGWDTLGNLVSVKKCVEVGSDEYLNEGIAFVSVSNLSPFEITEEKYISEKLYSELTEQQPKKGEILLSKDATPGIAYYLQEDLQKMIPSGGILRLKLKDNRINEEYLTLVLNSLITKEQINRDVGGSVILHWRPDQVKQTLIPVANKDIQSQIKEKITESFNLRKQSKHLLECAKKAVEMEIGRAHV